MNKPVQAPASLMPDEVIVFNLAAKELAHIGVTVMPEFLSAITLMATSLQKFKSIRQIAECREPVSASSARRAALSIGGDTLCLNRVSTARLLGRGPQ